MAKSGKVLALHARDRRFESFSANQMIRDSLIEGLSTVNRKGVGAIPTPGAKLETGKRYAI